MKPEKADRNHLKKLTDLPNVGASSAADLKAIGINDPIELKGQDPYELYEKLCKTKNKDIDPCILDIFISAVRFINGEEARPWWTYSDERKSVLALKEQTKPSIAATTPNSETDMPKSTQAADDAGGTEGTNPNADIAKNGRIDYIELPCCDLAQTEEFFRTVFDWSFTAYGESYTAFSGSGINGGFYLSKNVNHTVNGGALIVIYDANLPATQARIVDAGGYISQALFAFPGGHRFHFLDPNGNEWAVWSDQAV